MKPRTVTVILDELKAIKDEIQRHENELTKLRAQRHDLVAEALGTGRVNFSGISLFLGENRTQTAVQFRKEILRREHAEPTGERRRGGRPKKA